MPATYRTSTFLTFDDGIQLVQAAAHAGELGQPLNTLVTIHLQSADLAGRWQDHRAALLKRFQQFLGRQRPDGVWHAIWVAENDRESGLHIHLLVHIPASRRKGLKRRIERWLKRLGGTPDRNTVDLIAVYDLRGAIGYLLKGMHECQHQVRTVVNGQAFFDTPAKLFNGPVARQRARGLESRTGQPLRIPDQGPQGRITGKRCGVSEAIGPKAQASYWAQRQLTRRPAVPTVEPARPSQVA